MSVEHVQTKREIVERLAAAGVRPRKQLGQHFLIEGNLMRRLVASAELVPQDVVLEVGGGTGGLTDLLEKRVERTVCVEADRALHAILEERFRGRANVTLIHGDILQGKHRLIKAVDCAIRSCDWPRGHPGCVKLVANLPYQVATPLVMNLLIDYPQVRRLCFTVQAEVAERIIASPDCKAYGPLSILAQALCLIRTVARLPARMFWPRPSVDSVMMRMDVGEPPLEGREALHDFAALVRGVFDHRRKTLRKALRYVVEDAQSERVCARFDATRRPESFSVPEWLEIYQATRPAGVRPHQGQGGR